MRAGSPVIERLPPRFSTLGIVASQAMASPVSVPCWFIVPLYSGLYKNMVPRFVCSSSSPRIMTTPRILSRFCVTFSTHTRSPYFVDQFTFFFLAKFRPYNPPVRRLLPSASPRNGTDAFNRRRLCQFQPCGSATCGRKGGEGGISIFPGAGYDAGLEFTKHCCSEGQIEPGEGCFVC